MSEENTGLTYIGEVEIEDDLPEDERIDRLVEKMKELEVEDDV